MKYECDGQIELTDYLRSKIVSTEVMDLTDWINSQGKSQYRQIGEVVEKICEKENVTEKLMDSITNAVSVYVLQQPGRYMAYFRKESEV